MGLPSVLDTHHLQTCYSQQHSGSGEVGVGGCARLRWSAAGMRSVSSAWLHYAQTLWAVSRGVIQLRGRGTGGSCQLGCLRLSHRPPIAPEFPAYVAPVACSPLIWSPGGRSPQQPTLQARPEKPVRTPGGSGSLGCSRLSRRPPIAPRSPTTGRFQSIPLDPYFLPCTRPPDACCSCLDRPRHRRTQGSRDRTWCDTWIRAFVIPRAGTATRGAHHL